MAFPAHVNRHPTWIGRKAFRGIKSDDLFFDHILIGKSAMTSVPAQLTEFLSWLDGSPSK